MERNVENSTNRNGKLHTRVNRESRMFQGMLNVLQKNSKMGGARQSERGLTQQSSAVTSNQRSELYNNEKDSGHMKDHPKSDMRNRSKLSDNCMYQKSVQQFAPPLSLTHSNRQNISQTIINPEALDRPSSHNQVAEHDCFTKICLNEKMTETPLDLKNVKITRTITNSNALNQSSLNNQVLGQQFSTNPCLNKNIEETPLDLKNVKITRTITNSNALNQSSLNNQVLGQQFSTNPCLNKNIEETPLDLKNVKITRTITNSNALNQSSLNNQVLGQQFSTNPCLNKNIEETPLDLKNVKITRTITNSNALNQSSLNNQVLGQQFSTNPCLNKNIEELYPDIKKITRTVINKIPLNQSSSHSQVMGQSSTSSCLSESIEIVSDSASAVDSDICLDEPDVSSMYAANSQKDKTEIDNKNSKWPTEQLFAISSLLKEIEKERSSPENHGVTVCKDFNSIARRYLKGCCCRLYGSYNSGLAIENSDINIELYGEGDGVGVTTRFLNEVQKIFAKEKKDYFMRYEVSTKLRDCNIMFIEPENGTHCNMKYLAHNNNFHTSELLKKLCSRNPCVKTLVIALRHWAEVCNIHEVKNGGLHALGYALMVIHFLQQHSPPVLPIVENNANGEVPYHIPILNGGSKENSVSELWISLLEYYSSFNWQDHVINITSLKPVLKASTNSETNLIWIQAPLDPNLNIAKSIISPDISQFIHMCFVQTYKYFSKATGTCVKQLSDDEIESMNSSEGFEFLSEIAEYKYCFTKSNFTEGIDVPQFCPECEELGYVCEDCFEESHVDSIPLSNFDEKMKEAITSALQEAYEEHMLKDEEVEKRIQIVATIENYIKKKFYDAKLELMGSTVNGFGFRKSDLDISLTFGNKELDENKAFFILHQLRQHLRRNTDFTSVLAIFNSKIPLVQFVHQKTGLRGDLSLYNLLGVENSKLLRNYSIIDKRARILGCAMKLLVKNAGISDTADRSLSSYSYIIMVIHYLQRTNPPILPALHELEKSRDLNIVQGWDVKYFDRISELDSVWKVKQNGESVSELWFGLLKYYTEDLDLQNFISIRDSKPPLIRNPNIKAARLFNIEDPFILSANLGAVMSESMSAKTQKTFLRARKLLSNCCTQLPAGFKTMKEYLFDPMNLTDGRISKMIECDICGKLGHKTDRCPRNNLNFGRGRGRPLSGRGYHHRNYQNSIGTPIKQNFPRNGNAVIR